MKIIISSIISILFFTLSGMFAWLLTYKVLSPDTFFEAWVGLASILSLFVSIIFGVVMTTELENNKFKLK
jgi:hypothetical protein